MYVLLMSCFYILRNSVARVYINCFNIYYATICNVLLKIKHNITNITYFHRLSSFRRAACINFTNLSILAAGTFCDKAVKPPTA